MHKNRAVLIMLMLTMILVQGCKESLERAYLAGENIDPDDPNSAIRAAAIPARSSIVRCDKTRAFGYYCLGSSIEALLNQRKPFRQYVKKGLQFFDFKEQYGLTRIAAYQGKILSAYRADRPANWQTLLAVRERVESRYGKADDRSNFAPDINTSRRMEFAVYSKQAKAHYVWSMSGWRIDVIWDNIRDIQITFLDENLNELYLANRNQSPSKP